MINNYVSFFDKKGLKIFETSYESFKKHNKEFNYFIGVSDDIFNDVKNIYFSDKRINIYNVDKKINEYNEPGFSSITNMTYARFHIDEIIPFFSNKREPFIYLDIDIIHSKKFTQLEEWKSKNIIFGAGPTSNETNGASYNFWFHFYKNKRNEIKDENLINEFDIVANKNLEMHKNNKNFNAGIMIINNPQQYFEVCENILKSKLWKILDDQTLLNYFSCDLFVRSDKDKIYNFMLNVNKELNKETIIYHFAGNNKELMLNFNNSTEDVYTYLEKNKEKW